MKQLTSAQIRQMWLDFWKSKGHAVEPSANLVPVNDPTLLWINSGVATLKKYFDGSVIPENPRITNSQKAIRTNDIENVGKTARHHTMFEMLGNFSVGDYFRDEAIEWGYELLTSPEWFDFPKDKLYIRDRVLGRSSVLRSSIQQPSQVRERLPETVPADPPAHHAQRIVVKRLARIDRRAQHALGQIVRAAERIDEASSFGRHERAGEQVNAGGCPGHIAAARVGSGDAQREI